MSIDHYFIFLITIMIIYFKMPNFEEDEQDYASLIHR